MKSCNPNLMNEQLNVILNSYPDFFIEEEGKGYENCHFNNWWDAFIYSESSKDFIDSNSATINRIVIKFESLSKKNNIDFKGKINNIKSLKKELRIEYKDISSGRKPLKTRIEAEAYIDRLAKIYHQLILLEKTIVRLDLYSKSK